MKKLLMLLLLILFIAGCSDATEGPQEPSENIEEESPAELDEESPEPDPVDEPSGEELPEITEDHIDGAIATLMEYDGVNDAHIEVDADNKRIAMAIVVGAATDVDYAKELGDNLVRLLGTEAALFSDLEMPTADTYGTLYDYYDVHIGVGTGPDDYIARGAKVTSSPRITW